MSHFTKEEVVVVYLQEPREKLWGVLLGIRTTGITLRGIPLDSFDDWIKEIFDGDEQSIGLTKYFFPMHRVERVIKDESLGSIRSFSQRFEKKLKLTVTEFMRKKYGSGKEDVVMEAEED